MNLEQCSSKKLQMTVQRLVVGTRVKCPVAKAMF